MISRFDLDFGREDKIRIQETLRLRNGVVLSEAAAHVDSNRTALYWEGTELRRCTENHTFAVRVDVPAPTTQYLRGTLSQTHYGKAIWLGSRSTPRFNQSQRASTHLTGCPAQMHGKRVQIDAMPWKKIDLRLDQHVASMLPSPTSSAPPHQPTTAQIPIHDLDLDLLSAATCRRT